MQNQKQGLLLGFVGEILLQLGMDTSLKTVKIADVPTEYALAEFDWVSLVFVNHLGIAEKVISAICLKNRAGHTGCSIFDDLCLPFVFPEPIKNVFLHGGAQHPVGEALLQFEDASPNVYGILDNIGRRDLKRLLFCGLAIGFQPVKHQSLSQYSNL